MEQLFGKAKNGNKDALNRMPQRPRAVKSGRGESKPKPKPTKTAPPVLREKPPPISEDESDDELLLTSQNSVTEYALPFSKRVAKGEKQYDSSDDDEIILVNGRTLKPVARRGDSSPESTPRPAARTLPPQSKTSPSSPKMIRPFPMSPQMFADIERRSKSPSLESTKRASSDDSEAEQGRTANKHKDFYLDEDDSVELDRDPSTLCPYRDEKLPPRPTAQFQRLLAMACKKSRPDARPGNSGGLTAPLTVYISVCQRHRFESHQLPIAAKKDWPTTIDFVRVPERVRAMKNILEGIILDKDDAGPRSQSVFWGEVKQELKKQGSRAMIGVRGQFATFEKTQPGYYGEQGFVIIHQTLFDLFPPSKFDASLISPLAPAEFIQRVLVPEVAARLIAQDLRVDMKAVIGTLRDSVQYGVAMFPDTAETKRKGDIGVADRIVMERACARRKEIAKEEEVERAALEERRAAYRARALDIRRERAMERARQIKARAEGKIDAGDVEGSDATDASEMRRAIKQLNVAADSGSKAEERSGAPDVRKIKGALGTSKQKSEFAALDSDEEHKSTPRPVRQRSTAAGTSGSAEDTVDGLDAQLARNRFAARPIVTDDGRSRSLRMNVPDGAGSAANACRRSQRLARQAIKKHYNFD